jgi:ribonuclease HIII
MNKSVYTYELTEDQQELLLGIMLTGNYRRKETPYSIYSIEGDHFNATLYQKVKHGKRKLCVQGSKASEFVEFILEPNVLGEARIGYEDILDPESIAPHAGSDESGKGDFFGPLVVCCAYINPELAEKMREIGVKDCKKMTDAAVLETGAALRRILGQSGYAVVKLNPPAYNRLYAKIKNINCLLAWAHGTAIEELLEKQNACPRVVVDQFAPTENTILRALKTKGKSVKVEQRHKAESDLAVAAASVIAREIFLREIRKEENALPAGSSDPRVAQVAVENVKKLGPNWLMNNAKVHFRTTDKVLEECGMTREALPEEGRIVSAAARNVETKKGEE